RCYRDWSSDVCSSDLQCRMACLRRVKIVSPPATGRRVRLSPLCRSDEQSDYLLALTSKTICPICKVRLVEGSRWGEMAEVGVGGFPFTESSGLCVGTPSCSEPAPSVRAKGL